jgi:hypothetical protein
MLVIKIVIVGVLALLATVSGGMAAAWRRACIAITRRVHMLNWMIGDGTGCDRPEAPGPGKLSNEDIIRFTPSWVSLRHLCALTLLALTVLAALVFFRWYVALSIGVGTYILMELAGFILPNRHHPYYVLQVHRSFSTSLVIALRFQDESRATEMQCRLSELKRAYRELLGPSQSDTRGKPVAERGTNQ